MIRKDLPNILKLLEDNKVLKIVGPTGSGKTTILPKELGKKYNVTVIVSKKDFPSYPNVNYITPSEYWTTKIGNLLVLDELDTGSLENFLILTDWRKKHSETTKLILNSLLPHNYFPSFPTYTIKPFCEKFQEIRYLKDYLTYQDTIKDLVPLVYEVHNSSISGDFLIFVLEVEPVMNRLKFLDAEILREGEVGKTGLRKIYVVQDSAKTYLRYTKFGCIFDTMRERRFETTLSGGVREKIAYISKRDANLRAKRSSESTIVYRLISLETFETLPDVTPELLFRLPLHILMIDLYERNLNPIEVLDDNFDIGEIRAMYQLFLKNGLLNISLRLTEKAKEIRKLPFGIKPSIIAYEMGNDIVASLIDNFESSPFLFQEIETDKGVFEYEMNLNEHISKYFNRFRGLSDIETLVNLYIDFQSSSKSLNKWCFDNFISYEYMNNVIGSIEKTGKIENLDSIMNKLYPKMVLDEENTILCQYYDEMQTPYHIDALSINSISEKRPKEIYKLITSSFENNHIVSLSYVSSETEFQKFEETPIIY